MAPRLRWTGVCIDCADADELAAFYERLLGYEVAMRDGGWIALRDPSGGTGLNIQAEADYRPPMWPENRDGQDKLMVVRMELEIGEVMAVEEVRYMLPRLRDAYIGTLSTLAGRGELVEESQRNATIKRALKLASDRVLGPDAIHDVLLQRAWQQPM